MKTLLTLWVVLCSVVMGSALAAETKEIPPKPSATSSQPQAPITYQKAVGVPANMLFKLDEKGGFAIPEWCEAWFDGCNNCRFTTHMGQLVGACSSRGCAPSEMKQPHCTKRKPEAKK